MNIVVILGSRNSSGRPRGPRKCLRRDCAPGGADVDNFFLPVMDIERCRSVRTADGASA